MATLNNNVPTWSNGATIQWYGERGIVNALVSHMAALPNTAAEAQCLLHAIRWADGAKPSWLDAVTEVRFLVEISLADFGNPDLMIACQVRGEALPYLVFVEAKVHPYPLSAGSNRGGMSAGYNSTINGQLTLKYRFACALANQESPLVEPDTLFACYREQLRDYAPKPRRLLKGAVVDILQGLNLVGLPESRCHYVALTWDDSEKKVFETAEDLRPLFLATDGSVCFATLRPRYGWLGYQHLADALGLGNSRSFQSACYGMLKTLIPGPEDYRFTRALENLTAEENLFVMQVAEQLAQACTGHRASISRQKGSLSITVDGAVVAKIIPGSGIFVGIRETPQWPLDTQALAVERHIQGVTFHGIVFPDTLPDLTADSPLTLLTTTLHHRYAT